MTGAFFPKARRIVAPLEYREFICPGKCSPRVSIVLYTVGQISHLEMSWEFVLPPAFLRERASERANELSADPRYAEM